MTSSATYVLLIVGSTYGIYATRGEVELLIQYEAKLSAVSGNETPPRVPFMWEFCNLHNWMGNVCILTSRKAAAFSVMATCFLLQTLHGSHSFQKHGQ